MRLREYLSDKKHLIQLYCSVMLFTGIMIYIKDNAFLLNSTGLYITYGSFIISFVYLTIDYLIKKKHFNILKELWQMEHMDWVNSLPEPLSNEQRIYTELIRKLYQQTGRCLEEHNNKSTEDLEFVTMWVHEIKTPIAASKLIIENSLDHSEKKALYSLEDEIDRIEDYVQLSLFYSRANDFAKDYMISRVSLEKVVNDCLKRDYSGITNKNLHLAQKGLELFVDTDEKWIGFILKQLLDNAIKYSPFYGKVEIYAEQNEKETVLFVEDHGIGIKEEDLNRIFTKNITGVNDRKYYMATGIGLYLSRKLAKKLGHNITVTSHYELGTKAGIHFAK